MVDNIPNELETIWDEAKDYIEQGNYDKAIEIYKYILIRYSGNDVAVRYANSYLGDIYLTLKQADLARIYIQKAIYADPEEPSYRYQLGFTCSYQHKWKQAIKNFEIAVKKKPDNGEYLRGLGWAIYNNGNTMEGMAILSLALEKEPKNINILNDLAVVYTGILDFKRAGECLKKILKIDPEDELARTTLQKIEYLQKRRKV